MSMPRRSLIGFLLVATIIACAAPQRSTEERASGESRPGASGSSGPKRFVAAIRGFPKSVSPTIDAAGAGSTAGLREVGQLVNIGLTTSGRDGKLVPRLAQA